MLHDMVDGLDQQLGAYRDQHRGHRHQADGRTRTQAPGLLVILIVGALPLIAGQHALVGDELEPDVRDVGAHDDHGADARHGEHLLLLILGATARAHEDGRQRARHASQQLHRHVHKRVLAVEELLLLHGEADRAVALDVDEVAVARGLAAANKPPEEKGSAQDEEDVRQDGAEQRRLDDAQQPFPQSLHGEDHLHRIAQGGVQ
mmetsp:Transcript_42189/g.121926  ORF Transcript_42189/g.121926 Transcript_42189/m.121926 type:complete len:204 (-) Transcript_42189:646-1257(-)